MTNYIRLPNGSYFEAEEGQTPTEARKAAFKHFPEAFGVEAPAKAAPKQGLMADVAASAKNLLNIGRTGIGALTGDTTAAALEGAKRQEKEAENYIPGFQPEKITEKWNKGEYLGSAGEAARQIPSAIAGLLPSVGQEMGLAALGRVGGGALGSLAGPAGTAIGATVGQYAVPLIVNAIQALGSQAQDKVDAQIKAGEKPDVNALELAPYATASAAANLIGTRIAMPSIFKKAIGQKVAEETGDAARAALLAEATKTAGRGTMATIGQGVGRFAIGELPTEVLQDVLDRAAVGKPLADDDAITQYRNTALNMVLAAPLGGAFGVRERSQARGAVEQQKAVDTAAASQAQQAQQAVDAAKAAADRESRIEEASIRSEGRAATLADKNYNRLRTDNVNDREIKRGEEMVDQQFKINEEERKLTEARAYENDPTTLTGQAKVASINASKASNESQRLELETKRKILEAGVEWEKATTPQAKQAAEDKVKALTGKIEDGITLETSKDIIGYDENGKAITSSTMMWVDKRHQTVTPVDTGETAPLSDAQVKSETKANSAAASAKANAVGGTNYTGYQDIKTGWVYDTDAEKEEFRRKEEYNKVYTETLANGGKAPTGMLGAKTSTPTSPAPFKADDPARQKEYDIIFGGVVKQHESGNKGVNANNPKSTAGGTYQLLDDTAIGYGAKPNADGTVSNAEKDRVAPKFYADVYKSTNGDPSAMIAAGFGQSDVKSAVKDAAKKGSKWWQEIDSEGVKNNMGEVYIRARESVARLQSAGIEPDARLLDFADNYKSTKIASNAPNRSQFKAIVR